MSSEPLLEAPYILIRRRRVRVYKRGPRHHISLLRFLSSGGSSSPSRSAVSAGFSSECTLLAMLLRLVGGAEMSNPLNGNRGPGNCQPASLLVFAYPGGPASGGGVVCRELYCWFEARGSSYCASASRSCWSPLVAARYGDDGHCVEFCPEW